MSYRKPAPEEEKAIRGLNAYVSSPPDDSIIFDEEALNTLVELAHGKLESQLGVQDGTPIYRGISTYDDTFNGNLPYFVPDADEPCGVVFGRRTVAHPGSWNAVGSSWTTDPYVGKMFAEGLLGRILLRAKAPYAAFGGHEMAQWLGKVQEKEVIVVGPVAVDAIAWAGPDCSNEEWDRVVGLVMTSSKML